MDKSKTVIYKMGNAVFGNKDFEKQLIMCYANQLSNDYGVKKMEIIPGEGISVEYQKIEAKERADYVKKVLADAMSYELAWGENIIPEIIRISGRGGER